MELTGRWPARVFAVVVVWFWFVSVTREVGSKRAFASAVEQNRGALQRARGARVPVVLASIHVMYPLVAADWGRGAGSVFLDVSDSSLAVLFPETGQRFDLLRRGIATAERDLARVHSRRFGFPTLLTQAQIDTVPRFVLFVPARRLVPGFPEVEQFARVVFPNHRPRRLDADLWFLERAREDK